jgi:hypothetical protein
MHGGPCERLQYLREFQCWNQIMALNLAGKGGLPLALGASSAGAKSAIDWAGKWVLGLGLDFQVKLAFFQILTVAIATAIAIAIAVKPKTLGRVGSMKAMVYEGHALNSPEVPAARSLGSLLLVGMIAASGLTAYANDQRLTLVERVSAIGVFLCCAALFSGFDSQPQFMTGGFVCATLPAIRHWLNLRHKRVEVPGNHR